MSIAGSIIADNPSLFRAMLDQSPAPGALLSPDGRLEYVNPAFAELHDRPVGQLTGRSILELIDPEDHPSFHAELRRLGARDCDTSGLEVRPAPPGLHQRIRYRLAPQRDDAGKLTAVMLFGQSAGSIHLEPLSELTLNAAQVLFDKSPIPMWVFDIESLRFLEVNHACLKRYGYSREEFLRLTTRDIRPKEELPKLFSGVIDILSVPYPNTRWTHQRKDGSTFVAEVFATPIRFGSRPARLVLSFDVTERVQAERALQERNTRLEALGDNLPGGAIYQIIQGPGETQRFSYFSRGFERMFGFTAEAVIADPGLLMQGIHPDDWPGFDAAQRRCMIEQVPFDHEFRQRTAWGEAKWIHCRSAPRPLPDGTVAWDGVVTEITERKRTEETLRRQREVLQSLGDNLPGGAIYQYVSEPDGNGRYTHISAGIEAISELKPDDLLSGRLRLRDLIHLAEDRERIVRAGESATAEPSISDTEVSVRLPSGRDRIWHIRTAIRRQPDNSILWDGVILDVTDRRKLEIQVQQAQKFQSVGVLAGGIAHDFNNLLTGVLGFAELAAAETPPDHPTLEYLTEIGTSARRAADLCKQMLAYAGKGRLVRGPTDLSAMVREMTPLLKAAISRKAELQLELAERMPPTEGDASQLRQVMMNLIINASEALEEKPGRIVVRTGLMAADPGFFRATVMRDDLPPGAYAYLEIEDTGHGMTPETQARIFEPFFTTKFSGRGLGLSALLGIVRGHRGAVRVTSELGRGTTFRIVLPVAAAPSEPPRPPAGMPRRAVGPVLVIDDEESVRTLARMALEKAGLPVTTAEDGEAGVAAFQQAGGNFVVVLTDLTMPKLSGLETLTALRKIKPDIRVVLMSGHGEAEVSGRHTDGGFAGFLQKPFTPAELAQAIERAVARP